MEIDEITITIKKITVYINIMRRKELSQLTYEKSLEYIMQGYLQCLGSSLMFSNNHNSQISLSNINC